MKYPEYLNKGDVIAIIAPAKAIEKEYIDFAVELWTNMGYKVVVSPNCLKRNNYFSGTIEERSRDLQWAIDHKEAKAIICARGGYGCIHTINHVNWNEFLKNPKWIIGYSDVTVYHFLLATFTISSIHGSMPLNYKDNSEESIHLLNDLLIGNTQNFNWKTDLFTQGEAKGIIIGGNLAVISDLIGTSLQPDMKGKILFLEEVGEYNYTIDRMFYQLKLSGILNSVEGIVIGNFSNVGDTEVPFGKSVKSIIFDHCKDLNIPIAFDFPLGHENDNRPLKCGGSFSFNVNKGDVSLVELNV